LLEDKQLLVTKLSCYYYDGAQLLLPLFYGIVQDSLH